MIRSNRAYHDPALGQAFSNLAAAFAPPSGNDLAGYATANAKNQESQRLAQQFAMSQSPDFNQDLFDRGNIAAGLYNPTQSYYAQNQNNSTARYGIDTTAATSRANNLLTNQTDAITSLYGALSPGEVAPEVPVDLMGVLGLPGIGERTGLPPILTETQHNASVLASMPPELQQAAAFGSTPVETILGPNGPEITTRLDAIGQTPMPSNKGMGLRVNADGSIEFGTDGAMPGPTTANTTSGNNRSAEITSALNTLDVYEELIRNNPGTQGMVGLIRGSAQNAVAAANDLAQAFGKNAPQIEEAAADIRNGLGSVAPEMFDPSIPEAQFLQATLAYAIARTENPSGEVSRQAYERAHERISGGLLGNSQETLANIGAYRKVLQNQLSGVDVLRDPSQGRTDTSFQPSAPAIQPGTIEDGYRFIGGDPANPASWERVQ